MKQKTKKLITIGGTVLLGLSLIGNVALGINLANENGSKGLSGSVNESWQKNDAYIDYQTTSYSHYSSADGDYIWKVHFYGTSNNKVCYIYYKTVFSISDDLDVYFVLANKNLANVYTTKTETTHSPYGGDSIFIPESDMNTYDLWNCHISEIWVRTID